MITFCSSDTVVTFKDGQELIHGKSYAKNLLAVDSANITKVECSFVFHNQISLDSKIQDALIEILQIALAFPAELFDQSQIDTYRSLLDQLKFEDI